MSPAALTDDERTRTLAVEVARRYYIADESKSEIGASLGISRFKVARLLQTARTEGWVRIEIDDPDASDPDLAERLCERFGLDRVVVTASEGDLTQVVGGAAARLLSQTLTGDDVLGLPWSRTVAALVDALADLPPLPVVQLSGSLVIRGESSPVDVVRAAARVSGGEAHVYYAPLVLDDEASAAAILRHPDVAAARDRVSEVSVALVSVGAWAPGQSTIHDAVSDDVRRELAERGVVGEAVGICFDRHGALVDALAGRLVAVTAEQLRGVGRVVALASRASRAEAVSAFLRTGLADWLVVDRALAERLLALPIP